MPYPLRSLLVVGTLAAALTSCREVVPPYYQFTAADREWMSFQPGTVWTFENSRGAHNRFRVDSAVTHEHRAIYLRTFAGGYSGKVSSYYDEYLLQVSSLDSVGQVGHFRLTCTLPDGSSGTALTTGDSDWATYIGVDSGVGGFIPCWLPFPADLRKASFQELTVGGRRYTQVLALLAVGHVTRQTTYGLRTSVRQLYYDRQAGVVRMVAESGDIWNRVP